MAGERALPGLGLIGFWDLGDNTYKTGLDGNLRLLSAMVQPRILSLLAAAPASPTDGDIHIATAVWGGATVGDILIRDDGSWVPVSPQIGWRVYDVSSGDFIDWGGTVWQAVVGGLFVGTYIDEAALIAAHPSAAPGSSANVDAGVGEPVALWIWDDDDDEWVASGSTAEDMTGEEIVDAIDAELGSSDWQTVGGDLVYSHFNDRYFCLPNETGISTSLFATKGSVFDCLINAGLISVRGYMNSSQTIKCVVAEVDETASMDVVAIIGESAEQVITATGENFFPFSQPLNVEAGKRYSIMFVRTDGTSTTSSNVAFVTATPGDDLNGIWDFVASTRLATLDPAIGDSAFYNTSGAARATLDTVTLGAESLVEDILIHAEFTANRTLTDADFAGGRFARMNVAGVNSVTVPPGLTGRNAVTFIQEGAGQTTFVPGAGVTIKSPEGNLSLRVQYSSASLVPDLTATDEYFLMGDLV